MNIALERAYPTPFANSPLLPLLLLSLARQKHTPQPSRNYQDEYDYIVVGGGSAGSVVASRLSEEKCVSVLLLEAGKSPPLLNDVPSISRDFINSDLDWQYKTVPQKHTGKFHVNKQISWPSGKGVGGSDLLSAMIYSKGNPKNYDDWAEQGAEGWSYKDIKKYFLKIENNTDPEYLYNGHHSSKGPFSIHKPRYEAMIKRPILTAMQKHGYHLVDPNAANQTEGFYDFQAFLRNSQRCTAAKAYLVPAENRENLDIIPKALVTKVVLEGTKATGVEFEHNGSTHTVKARREVILSAGGIKTPQILMLSGIGPKEHLEELDIPVLADLPVGNNFHDHASVPLTYELPSRIPTTQERVVNFRNIREYIHNKTGPLASPQFTSLIAFVNGESASSEETMPIAEIYFAELTTKLTKTQIGLKPQIFEQVFGSYEGKPIFTCIAHALQPKSRGTIRLQSNDPHDSPLIDPNYFADPKDIEDTVKALKVCHKLSTSQAMRKIGARPLTTPVPGCEHVRNNPDRLFECIARSIVVSMSHSVGTARMGNPNDPTTVVDPQLRVKGIQGLRVVDASVMPIIPSGNMNFATMMVAEKASDIIKETVQCQSEESENSIHAVLSEN